MVTVVIGEGDEGGDDDEDYSYSDVTFINKPTAQPRL